MKIKETADGLEVRHVPGCMWFLGIMFILAASTFIYGYFGGFSNYNEIETWEYYIGLFIAISVLIGGVYVISTHPYIVTSISGKDRKVTILKRNFLRNEKLEFKFADVSRFEIIEEKDSDDDSFFYIHLITKTGKKTKISSQGLQIKEYVDEINYELNRYFEQEKLLDK